MGRTQERRRSRPDEWARNKRHADRVAGRQYVSTSKKVVPARQMKERTCRFNCLNNCWSWSEEQRQAVYEKYWNLGNEARQKAFLLSCVEYKESEGEGQRRRRLHYLLKKKGDDFEKVSVCRQFILDTLCVSERQLRNVLDLSEAPGVVKTDMRGKHGHQKRKFQDAQLDDARSFISELPAVPSHYSRQNTTRKYLPTEWRTIHFVYSKYLDVTIDPISEGRFREIFNNEFNIGFHLPKKDKCEVCFKGWNAEHQKLKDLTKERHKVDQERAKNDNTFRCTSFDLEKVLTTPHGESVLFFYARKLAVYNFTLYEVATRKGLCNIWNETDGKRGANEIATIVSEYIRNVDSNEPVIQELSLFCDNCPGQNKNRIMIAALHATQVECRNIKKITLNFLLKGHTYLPCDSMHAAVEANLKRQLVFAPSEWKTIVRTARHTPFPYDVKERSIQYWKNWCAIQKRILPNTVKGSLEKHD